MQTFKQFLEAREVKDIEGDHIIELLRHINDPIISIKFALHCAEDCFHLNNENIKRAAKRCITLVRRWLNGENVSVQELRNARYEAYVSAYDHTDKAIYVAAYAAETVIHNLNNNNRNLFNCSSNAAHISAEAHASENPLGSPECSKIRNQKLTEYANKLKSLTTTRSGNPITMPFLNDIQDDDNDLDNSEYINDSILSSIMAMIDHLYDEQETGEKHFFYEKGNDFIFDLGNNVKLTAKNLNDLAKKIYQNKYFLRRLKELYRQSQ